MANACGKSECYTSTGIHDGLTFGSGELDDFGYWSEPCDACARAFDSVQREEREEFRAEAISDKRITPEESEAYLRQNHEWLFIPGWPFPATKVPEKAEV